MRSAKLPSSLKRWERTTAAPPECDITFSPACDDLPDIRPRMLRGRMSEAFSGEKSLYGDLRAFFLVKGVIFTV